MAIVMIFFRVQLSPEMKKMAIGDTRSPLHMQPPPHYGLDVFLPREKGDTNTKPQDDDGDDDGDDNFDEMHSDDDIDDVEMPSANDVPNTKHSFSTPLISLKIYIGVFGVMPWNSPKKSKSPLVFP